uniref:Probable ribonuclease ZC3H12D n=1 Tax=Cacopsylla melanoneura TaxID=428564 RepID=A0A8D8YG68_9HEMI
MTSREIKKFTPYKRIVRGSDISSPNKPNQEPVSSENQYQVIETQAPHPQDSHSQDKVRVKMSRKSKSEKRSKTLDKEQSLSNVLIEECSTSGEDKHDKENTTQVEDIIQVEDSNDATDCVIVIDGNGNNVKSSGKSQTVSCSLERKECSSPGKHLNSHPLGSTQVLNFSKNVSVLSDSFSKTCSPKTKHKKKSHLKKSKKNAWDDLFGKVSVLNDNKTDLPRTRSQSKSIHYLPLSQEPNTSSAQTLNKVECSSFKSTSAGTSSSSCSYQIDLTSQSNKSPNSTKAYNKPTCMNQTQTNTKTSSQSNCSDKIDKICSLFSPSLNKRQKTQCSTQEDGPVWITLDETIVPNTTDETMVPGLEISSINNSDVLIIDSTDCETSSQVSTGPLADESVIIDLEMIAPAGTKPMQTHNNDPLIVFDQPKPSTSCAPWSNSVAFGICTTPDVIPLKTKRKSGKLGNRTKIRKLVTKEKKQTKKGKRLSLVEKNKLSAIRNIVYDPNHASSSGTIWKQGAPPICPQGTPKSTNSFSHVLRKGLAAPSFGTQKGGHFTSSNPVGSSCVPSTSRGANQQALFGCPVDGLSKGGRVRQGTTSVFTSSVQQREDSNIYNPAGDSSKEKKSGLRPIVIDGCNVAMEHGKVVGPNSQFNFSGRGVQIVVDYFRKRGHKEIHVFIPHHKVHQRSTSNPEILEQLKTDGILTLTPSRFVEGKLQVAYDDRYIVQTAAELGGVIVSNDRYRDLMQENDKWKATIEQRLLMFNFVKDMLMFPQDPLGREGPTLDQFLKFPG